MARRRPKPRYKFGPPPPPLDSGGRRPRRGIVWRLWRKAERIIARRRFLSMRPDDIPADSYSVEVR